MAFIANPPPPPPLLSFIVNFAESRASFPFEGLLAPLADDIYASRIPPPYNIPSLEHFVFKAI